MNFIPYLRNLLTILAQFKYNQHFEYYDLQVLYVAMDNNMN
jgi:hypothetical protein